MSKLGKSMEVLSVGGHIQKWIYVDVKTGEVFFKELEAYYKELSGGQSLFSINIYNTVELDKLKLVIIIDARYDKYISAWINMYCSINGLAPLVVRLQNQISEKNLKEANVIFEDFYIGK